MGRKEIADALENFRPLVDESGKERYAVIIGPGAMKEIIACLRDKRLEPPTFEELIYSGSGMME